MDDAWHNQRAEADKGDGKDRHHGQHGADPGCLPAIHGFGKGHIRKRCGGHAEEEEDPLYTCQQLDLSRFRHRQKEDRPCAVDANNDGLRREGAQEALLRQPVDRPHHRRAHHDQHAQTVVAEVAENIVEPVVKEDPHADEHQPQPAPLKTAKAFSVEDQTTQQQQDRRCLDQHLRAAWCQVIQRQ